MAASDPAEPRPAQSVLQRWGLTTLGYLGSRANTHWLVERGGTRLALRQYPVQPFADISYEIEVMRRLRNLGWPVPEIVTEPERFEGRDWCLFSWLPGEPRAEGRDEQRARGRLLAEFHEATAGFVEMGQRKGFRLSDEVVSDPDLIARIVDYERLRPAEGHVLRWHLEEVQERFASLDLDTTDQVVLHSDFARWNLLFENGELSGLLDFEGTHLNYRVADFALSWRGGHDDLIAGYCEVRELSELDRQLLTPCYWSWLFLGVKDEIGTMLAGTTPIHGFDWPVDHLLRRSPLMGEATAPYPGR